MVKPKIFINTTLKINEIMKICTIIREELLKELDMSRERGLLSNLMMKYMVMGDSFTIRHGTGEKWLTKNELKEILMKEYKMNKESVGKVIDAYLEIEKNKKFGI